MKKIMILTITSLLCLSLFGCELLPSKKKSEGTKDNTKKATSEVNTNVVLEDEESINYAFNQVYPGGEVKDTDNGFSSVSDIKSLKAFRNGEYVNNFTSSSSRQDIKLELYSENKLRFVNVSNGYAFTLPYTDVNIDYEIAKYHVTMEFEKSTLNVSFESSNPYMSLANPWYTYNSEWLMRHLFNDDYINNNGLERTMPMEYTFTKTHSYGDLEFKDGFDCYFFGIKIKDPDGTIEKPYYNIAVVRLATDAKNFALFVMKSEENQQELMESIITSYKVFNAKGTPKNYFYSEAATKDPNWNEETLAYFNKLIDTEYVNWGVFSYSMPSNTPALVPGNSNYDSFLSGAKTVQQNIEAQWNHDYEIYPTYTHISWGSDLHYFPTNQANELAGGNGFNGKPVLQFTYQFTFNNNIVADEVTPMFDIMRGVYDEHFTKLAKDIKAYGKPVLFRLNNEMNTDWTSYSGMMTLLDPDIFNITWQRLYNIFVENGVDNVIWIWNPIATSCPYSSWGEDLCYFPGTDYVQLLGGTNYEFNNYSAETAATEIKSFKTLYSTLFKKNCQSFSTEWKLIISEFACGSGGATTGALGRNAQVQADWVTNMFKELNSATPADYVKQIRGAVWFNANDYSGTKISNRLQLCSKPGINDNEKYNDLGNTMAAFRQGFIDQDERLGITRDK